VPVRSPLEGAIARSLAEAAPDALLLVNDAREIVFVNTRGLDLFGYSEHELLGQLIDTLVPAAQRARHIALHQGYVQSPRFRPMGEGQHLWACRRDGSLFPVEITLSPVVTEQGHFTAAAVRDISSRLQAEQALREAEEHFRALIELAPDAIVVANPDGSLVQVNSAASRLLGYSAPELLSRTVFDLLAPDEIPRLRTLRQTLLAEGSTGIGEWQVRHRDGSEFPTEVSANILPNGRWQAILRDIRERKQLEREREESLHWLHEVLAQSPVGIVLCHGPACERCQLNRHAQHLLGLQDDLPTPTHLIFADDRGVLPDDQHPVARALRGEQLSGLTLSLQRVCGEFVPVLLDAAPIRSQEGGPVRGAVVVFQDITVLKQLDRLRAEWNAVIAHDLRQPLNAIALSAQLIARKKKDGADVGRPVELITSSARRLNRMINDLLDLSRLEARQLKLVRQPVDLASLIHVSVERIAAEAPDRSFDLRLPSGLPFVDIDGDRIVQVLDNLLSNAIKYGTAETPIEIEVTLRELELVVSVKNQGPGIAPEDLPHLFQRFHRVGKDQQSHIKGVGLGLYIVQQLIEAHGGRVQAESMPGGQTTFRFSLPRAGETPRSEPGEPGA
jgi:PAS domain S-box-containing protein